MENPYGQKIPVIVDNEHKQGIDHLAETNITLSKSDWDSFETSWNFTTHPLVCLCHGVENNDGQERAYLEDAYNEWKFDREQHVTQLKSNEDCRPHLRYQRRNTRKHEG